MWQLVLKNGEYVMLDPDKVVAIYECYGDVNVQMVNQTEDSWVAKNDMKSVLLSRAAAIKRIKIDR